MGFLRKHARLLARLAVVGVVLAGILVGVVYWRSEVILRSVAGQLGYDLTGREFKIDWKDWESVSIRDFRLSNAVEIGHLDLKWKWSALLLRREVEEVRVYGLSIWLKNLQDQSEGGSSSASGGPGVPITLKGLYVYKCTLYLDNLYPGLPRLPVTFAETTPLVFENLRIGAAANDPSFSEVITATANDVVIYSPYDPLTKVLEFDQITLGFSFAGLIEHQIDQVTLTQPVIYISDGLFWFLDEVKARAAAEPAVTPAKTDPWIVNNFKVQGGRIILSTFSRAGFALPFVFETESKGLNLQSPQLQTKFVIKKTNYPQPKLDLDIIGMEGNLFFGLPLAEKNATNIVPSLTIELIKWKGMEVSNVALGLTFDRKGIYGSVQGATYGGYTTAGFAISMDEGFPWHGWGSITNMNVEPVTRLLSPDSFVMKGPVTGTFDVTGRMQLVKTMKGSVRLPKPGVMTIQSIDDLIGRLPAEWPDVKKDMARIALESFRNYDYASGSCDFNYGLPVSELTLKLDGKQGKRNFQVRLHQDAAKGVEPVAIEIN